MYNVLQLLENNANDGGVEDHIGSMVISKVNII